MTQETFERVLETIPRWAAARSRSILLWETSSWDKKLTDRFEALDRYPLINWVVFVTNAVYSDQLDDEALEFILRRALFRISIYGLDPEEHKSITKIDDYDRFVVSMRRMLEMALKIGRQKVVQLSITLREPRSRDEIQRWMDANWEKPCRLSIGA